MCVGLPQLGGKFFTVGHLEVPGQVLSSKCSMGERADATSTGSLPFARQWEWGCGLFSCQPSACEPCLQLRVLREYVCRCDRHWSPSAVSRTGCNVSAGSHAPAYHQWQNSQSRQGGERSTSAQVRGRILTFESVVPIS